MNALNSLSANDSGGVSPIQNVNMNLSVLIGHPNSQRLFQPPSHSSRRHPPTARLVAPSDDSSIAPHRGEGVLRRTQLHHVEELRTCGLWRATSANLLNRIAGRRCPDLLEERCASESPLGDSLRMKISITLSKTKAG